MAVDINLTQNGVIRSIPVGFSWTTLFFGFFVPLFRGDWIWFLIMLFVGVSSLGVLNLIFAFLYNRIYANKLISSGWVPADNYSETLLRIKGIIV